MSDAGRVRDTRRVRGDLICTCVIQFTVLAVSLAWSLRVVSFLDVKEAALWLGVLVLAVCSVFYGRDLLPGFRALAPCWIVLAAAIAVGVATAPVTALVLYEGLRIAPLLLLGSLAFDLLQHPRYRVSILRSIVCAALCAAGLALMQRAGFLAGAFPRFPHYDQEMYSVFGNEGLLAGFLAVGLSTLPGVLEPAPERPSPWWCKAGVVVAAGLLVVTILFTESRGALAAALAGMASLLFARVISWRIGLVGLIGFVFSVLALYFCSEVAPWEKWWGLFSDRDVGGNVRRWILGACVSLAGEHPVVGCGLGNFAREIPEWLGRQALISARGANTLTTDHAHLDFLEWVCENGLVGVTGALWVVASLRSRYPVALCGLLTLFTFSLTHPAFYSAPHALIGVLLYAVNLPVRAGRREGIVRAPLVSIGVALLVAIGVVTYFMADFYPSVLLRRAEGTHLAGGDARADYERATRAWGYHPQAHESYGMYAYGRGDYTLAREHLLRARPGLETGRVYHLLALVATAGGQRVEACLWYEQCLARWPWESSIQARYCEICETGVAE